MVLVRSPQAIESERARAYALHALMCGSMLGWRNRARRVGPESIRIREGLSDEWGKAHAICTYGATLVGVGDWEQACELLSTALVIFDRTADHWEANAGLWNRALARFLMGDIEAARSDAVAVCARAESIGDSQAFALASCIEAFATDGVSLSCVRSFAHDSYDIQQSVSLWMAEAMKNLGTGDLLGAMNCLEAAVDDVRRNGMFNTYTVPAFSWRVTVARWLSAIEEPGSRVARMWAWRAVRRSLTLAALALVYSSERRYLVIEIKNFPRVLARAYKIDRAMAILKRVLGAIPRPAVVSPEPAAAAGPARGQGADQQAAIVESFRASIDAGSVVLADVPARPSECVRVVSGSMLPEHLTWLRQRGHLRTGGEHSCIRFQARPRCYTRFLVFPIEGFAGRFLVGELKGIYPVGESTWKAGRLAQGWLQHLYASERAADAMAMSLIFTEELFRTKLAAELHDDIGQRLSALLMETQRVRRAILQGAASQNGGQGGNGRDVGVAGLGWICEQLAECNEAVRKLVYEASSPTLQQFGLRAAIRDLIEQVQVADKLDVTCEFNATGDLDYGMLSTTTQTACLRIVQEAVTNVIKHADAQSCSVSLTLGREGLVLRIEDDGVGFDKAVKPRGFGLNSMRERATVLGGTMVVDTSVGTGVRLVATLPVDPIRDEGDDGE
jgi:signal transduction histidine kinase